MSDSSFESLEAVIQDESFPDTDLALRRGRHIGRADPSYDFLVDAASHLEPLYRRFGCELVQRSDGYFYLLPSGDRLGRRHLSTAEMLGGQTLALCYLDPATLEQSGAVPREVLLQRLVGLIGQESLVRTLNPRRKRLLERVSEETVRKQVGEAVRRLADLGFVDMLEESHLRLRPALLRFADPVRDQQDPSGALERLVAEGEIVLAEPAEEEDATSDDEESVE